MINKKIRFLILGIENHAYSYHRFRLRFARSGIDLFSNAAAAGLADDQRVKL